MSKAMTEAEKSSESSWEAVGATSSIHVQKPGTPIEIWHRIAGVNRGAVISRPSRGEGGRRGSSSANAKLKPANSMRTRLIFAVPRFDLGVSSKLTEKAIVLGVSQRQSNPAPHGTAHSTHRAL